MSLNPIAAVVVAALLLLAVKNNQQHQLLVLLSQEGGFVKWIIALGVVLWIYNAASGDGKLVIGGLLALAAIASILRSETAIQQIDQLVRGN